MQHNAAFQQGLHCLKKAKEIFKQKNTFNMLLFLNYNQTLQEMYNGPSKVYYIKPEGKIH